MAGWQERNAWHEPHQLVSDDASRHLKKIRGKPIRPEKPTRIKMARYARTPANRPARQEWDMDNLKRLKVQVREVGGKGAHAQGSGVWFGNKALSWHTFHSAGLTAATKRG